MPVFFKQSNNIQEVLIRSSFGEIKLVDFQNFHKIIKAVILSKAENLN